MTLDEAKQLYPSLVLESVKSQFEVEKAAHEMKELKEVNEEVITKFANEKIMHLANTLRVNVLEKSILEKEELEFIAQHNIVGVA